MDDVYNQIHYKFDRKVEDLPRDKELKVHLPLDKKLKPLIERNGLPQGLSVSPILATSVMAFLPKLEGLVMYADDGLIIRKEGGPDGDIKR